MDINDFANLEDCYGKAKYHRPDNINCKRCDDVEGCKEKIQEKPKRKIRIVTQPKLLNKRKREVQSQMAGKIKPDRKGNHVVGVRDQEIYDETPIRSLDKTEQMRHYVNMILNLHPELRYRRGANGWSIWHKHFRRFVISIGGSITTLRLCSQYMDPDMVGCQKDPKGYHTIVFLKPTKHEIVSTAKAILRRLNLVK